QERDGDGRLRRRRRREGRPRCRRLRGAHGRRVRQGGRPEMTEPTPETTTPEEQERAELFAWFDENRSLCQAAIAAVRQHEPPAADVDDSTTVYYAIRVPLQTRTDRQFLDFARSVQRI